ncbi:hypothetical protein TEA_021005 [Camellia sinensis var. sinensis]|uniref:Serine carboxypeptidase-like 18 n=1 Tax=Camellia sinensis var. sinensis TaxID=542762 RepID=A0A4S4E260_CAMSN|nr:hypothetical protein TEA_021005 [Camellia sinensis var. sinensis]
MAPQAKVEHQQRLIKMSLCIFLVLALSSVAASQSLVKYLPGFDGELPFNLETGYIGIGDTDDVQLFYYFIESERDPVTDPLVLWLTGGPGCSGFSALVYEIGPLLFDVESWTGQLPSLRVNKYSWTKVANIIFIDQPVGTGFSYARTSAGYNTSDTKSVAQIYSFLRKVANIIFIDQPVGTGFSYARTSAGYNTSDTKSVAQVYSFLRKWLVYHPQFQTNPLYIGGDTYSGITVPLLVQTILDGLDEGLEPLMGLQGYLLGNPVTDSYIDDNSRIPYVHRVNLISDELYEDAKLYCHGDYVNVQFNNSLCVTALLAIKHLTNFPSLRALRMSLNLQCLLQINLVQILEPQCAFSSPRRMEIEWDLRVREAETIEYLDSLNKLPELTCRSFSYMLSDKWANDKAVQKALNVREGAGYTAPEYKRKEALNLVDRWFAYYPI